MKEKQTKLVDKILRIVNAKLGNDLSSVPEQEMLNVFESVIDRLNIQHDYETIYNAAKNELLVEYISCGMAKQFADKIDEDIIEQLMKEMDEEKD